MAFLHLGLGSLVHLLLLIMISSAQDVKYVKPNSSSPCGGRMHCKLLEEYDMYFTSGTTFKFLPGNHSLWDHTLMINGSSNITLIKSGGIDSAVNIILSNSSIQCYSVTNLTILGLKFILRTNHMGSNAFVFEHGINILFSGTKFLVTGSQQMRSIKMLNSAITIRDCLFESSCFYDANFEGGAVHANDSNIIFTGNNSFISNTAQLGGAIYAHHSWLESYGNQHFLGNRAIKSGGGMFLSDSILFCDEKIVQHFVNNEAGSYGGGIYLELSSEVLLAGNQSFIGNNAHFGGSIYSINSSIICLAENSTIVFKNNLARVFGGAILCLTSILEVTADFISNHAALRGGGILIVEGKAVKITEANFLNNTVVGDGGGAVHIEGAKNVSFKNVQFTVNTVTPLSSADMGKGGAVFAVASHLSFSGFAFFNANTADLGGALFIQTETTVSFLNDSNVVFFYNKAKSCGGALYAVGSTWIIVEGIINFTSNSARQGGAMYFRSITLTLKNNSSFNTAYNHASQHGGGIYYYDDSTATASQCNFYEFSNLPYCFLQFDKLHENGSLYTFLGSLNVLNDSSGKEGDFLYGGMIDRCRLKETRILLYSIDFFQKLFESNNGAVTLKPYQLRFCDNSGSLYTYHKEFVTYHKEVIRGENFAVSLKALDTVSRITATTVYVKSTQSKMTSYELTAAGQCQTLDLTSNLHSTSENNSEVLELYLDPCKEGPIRAVIRVSFVPCPNAFTLSPHGRCICEKRLLELGADCKISQRRYFIEKDNSRFWLGVDYSEDGTYNGLILSQTCPWKYCNKSIPLLTITLDNLDIQCSSNRIGVLCGACATNYSLTFGSSECQKCSNTYLALLLLLFAIAGFALVILLTSLRLTVASGMINSLILYANIIQVNRNSFLFNKPLESRLVAWLNFDFGFKVCFYSGMDAYVQTWLQFAFPLYVWILISLIIFASRYSMKISKWIGSNPIAVLATLMLMSYAKLLSIFIEVYSFVELDYPDNKTVTRWLRDANVPYMESKHLVLAVVTTLVLLLFFLPYTFLLLLGYKLYSYTDRKCFRWLLKIKPLLDSYYAPYKGHTRYWTGLMLLVRCVLYAVFSFNPLGAKEQSLLAIIITFTIVGVYFAFGRIYTKFYTSVIEASIYLNLTILSAITLANVNSLPLVYTMVGIFVLTMTGVILYHFYLNYIARSRIWPKVTAKLISLKKRVLNSEKSHCKRTDEALSLTNVTGTIISLRESLLESSSDCS